jgi:hypothetical protein
MARSRLHRRKRAQVAAFTESTGELDRIARGTKQPATQHRVFEHRAAFENEAPNRHIERYGVCHRLNKGARAMTQCALNAHPMLTLHTLLANRLARQ